MNWYSIFGLFGLVFLAFLMSEKKTKQNFRLIFGIFFLELILGYFLLKQQWGLWIFNLINKIIIRLVDIASEGSKFLFGTLAIPPGMEGSFGFILFFQGLPTIVFFSALISILYYYQIMNKIIEFFAFLFNKVFKISGAESLVAFSNIFVGIESILTVRPYILTMTRSELHTVLTSGFVTVASNVMAVYIFSLREVFPEIAGHLVVASILSAPAGIMFSKILVPETEVPLTMGKELALEIPKNNSLIEAIIQGSQDGLKLIFGITALLLSMIGLVTLVDVLIIYISNFFEINFSLKILFGYLFYPFLWMIGVPTEDVTKISLLIGERLILTEVVSYQDLALLIKENQIQQKSVVIASYVLCGFTHFPSLGIFLGGIQAIIPEKTKVLSQISFKALISATLADLFTGGIASLYFSS